ncbi:MAG TPA: bifunctional diaminohydroxyphosphoribosylaminopyrimidine deaminase/5-amino-6-(5-phosphoribosylamino)uracil reductase RibD [Candidatus Udaeobacter sp.]|nr:bifunctional diaminohydroxyphosphoribosylaminopyrimidine deaminase/5-amino-6-(5-phosphoribosylamino)uracil reductase RibD [Candidatus Udaeobacter sp.]
MKTSNAEIDRRFMRRALRLAERGRGRTRPNPIVGAVVVRKGRVVGEGWHTAAGRPHAERAALARAGSRARGATLYVTLEPCAHTGRTPPCVEAILAAGIRRCVVAIRDPHAIVNGRGLRALRRGGVRVDLGVCEDEASAALAGYRLVHRAGRPRVVWKIGVTLDGRIADAGGHSHWITGPAARGAVHRMRSHSDAIVIGSGTARADNPRLTARIGRGSGAKPGQRAGARRASRVQPLRVVCDTRLSLPLGLRLFGPLARGTVVACCRAAVERPPAASRRRALEKRGVDVWPLRGTQRGVSPRALARRLADAGCQDVLLECGPKLGASWLEAGLIDEIALFLAPRVLGDRAHAWSESLAARPLARAFSGRVIETRRLGDDVMLRVEVHH